MTDQPVEVGIDPHAHDQIAPALVAALAELTDPAKGSTATVKSDKGNYQYHYFSLPDLLAVARPVLGRHGLAVIQTVEKIDTGVRVMTSIWHTSGQRLIAPPLDMRCSAMAQDMGSAITYGRRYALSAVLGVAGAEDDDGAAAHNSRPEQRSQPSPAQRRQQAQQARRAPEPAQEAERPVERVQASPDDPANEPYQSAPPARPAAMDARREPSWSPHAEASDAQRRKIGAMLTERGVHRDLQRSAITWLLRDTAHTYDDTHPLTKVAAGAVIDAIEADSGQLAEWLNT